MNKKDWIVRIHKYIADRPSVKVIDVKNKKSQDFINEEMIDFQIEKEAKDRMIEYFKILTILKKQAVDCAIFSKFHAQVEIPYSCTNN